MKKVRIMSLLLTFTLLFSITTQALATDEPAAEPVTPTAPAWIDPLEYAVFSDGVAYEPETWEKILYLREHAGAGNPFPSVFKDDNDHTAVTYFHQLLQSSPDCSSLAFEFGLILLKYTLNMDGSTAYASELSDNFRAAVNRCTEGGHPLYAAALWAARAALPAYALEDIPNNSRLYRYTDHIGILLGYEQFTMDMVLEHELVNTVPEVRKQIAREIVYVTLDGELVHPQEFYDGTLVKEVMVAHLRNGRTMVPVRRLAELIGATVGYEELTREVTISRADDVIVLTIDSTTAYQNGVAFEMDVAPYEEGGRTYIPIRYIAEFFGQLVEWNEVNRHVIITENTAVVEPSNLEDWAIPMGAMLAYMHKSDSAHRFGGRARYGTNYVGTPGSASQTTAPDYARGMLEDGWSILNREDLIETIISMTLSGHNGSFLYDAIFISSLSEEEFSEYASVSEINSYMFPYTKQLYEKWGERGILCWDLFRMSNLVQWGYLAGYITYPEALLLLEPAATLLAAYFDSWDEAYENYLDGYHWWAREDVLDTDVWETERGQTYLRMKEDPLMGPFFDDSLFETGVISVPEEVFEDESSLPAA